MRDLISVFIVLAILGAILRFILAILVVVVVVAGAVAVVVAGVKLTEFWLVRHGKKRAAAEAAALAERARMQEVIRRAYQQNQLYLAGEDAGIYGEYPPADL